MDIVKDFMTKKVITCSPTSALFEIQSLMVRCHISRVVVGAQNKPVGIITCKDIVKFLTVERSLRSLEEINAKEVMSTHLITIGSNESTSKAAKIMMSDKISSLIVVDNQDNLEGIVTKADLTSYFAYRRIGMYTVGDFMSKDPITVSPSHSIFLVVRLMNENDISRVIVIDDNSKPVGIVTLADLNMIGSLFKPQKIVIDEKYASPRGSIVTPGVYYLTVKDIMGANPISIFKNADLSEAAKLMTRHSISGLPVINDSENLIGIVTKTDIIRALAADKILR